MPTPPKVRVVVQLPYNRPDNPHPDPPYIEWNVEKANILWEVIALSRTSDNGGTDWKGLATHLEVPLPYLLYRAQARYEEDLRGLQDIRGVLSAPAPLPALVPSTSAIQTHCSAGTTPVPSAHPLSIKIPSGTTAMKLAGIGALSARRLSTSQRLATPLGVRARLNSLTHKSPTKSRHAHGQGQAYSTHGKTTSSSTATLQGTKRPTGPLSAPLRPSSPFSDDAGSESSDEEELAQRKEEEIERKAEEQEQIDRKVAQLQKMMTSERLGLVKSPVSPQKGKGRKDAKIDDIVRGRAPFPTSAITMAGNGRPGPAFGSPAEPRFNDNMGLGIRHEDLTASARNRDHSASVSSVSSPQGSIPSIPSPSMSSPSPPPLHQHPSSPPRSSHVPPSQVQVPSHLHPTLQPRSLATSPMHRHLSPTKSSSPPAVAVRNARGQAQRRQGFGALGAAGVSEGESNHGSSASSFSDLSDASLSASALESALMSNIPGGGSRFSGIARSKFGGRGIRQ
ncbi:hypothetical protein PAXRUDRAFT_824129 [Paxillus rubicundulus Ve08.2h10]|uniref:Autophagy-related protein 29 n=1 Tax=Paxillus rubicundulus Ve08.2h10 TaxID=930991 RepID=A0A0D0E2H1_9AGAM|nr:hypothetical protein PAXRUDRAFT_824129 [Paxillus rubicundulus Ve08.2h10]